MAAASISCPDIGCVTGTFPLLAGDEGVLDDTLAAAADVLRLWESFEPLPPTDADAHWTLLPTRAHDLLVKPGLQSRAPCIDIDIGNACAILLLNSL